MKLPLSYNYIVTLMIVALAFAILLFYSDRFSQFSSVLTVRTLHLYPALSLTESIVFANIYSNLYANHTAVDTLGYYFLL